VAAESRHRRCATYTRKSSEEGLEQGFNSLDAQREACEAYIRSQAGEGWKAVRTHYDDGGYSGGILERPALSQLLADIRAGKIDTVVVYKVDRLTRSLADFAKIVEVFDANGVSFVSVTQQFNTTTSMGRLTLNMLLSFAQFEREVTGERIRDKIAASKRKGLWMGGHVPLGYEPDGRTLVINEAEAETVRTIFRLYLELGSVWRLKEEVDRLGLTTKRRPDASHRMRGGRPLSRAYLYKMLGNPLYSGRIAHNGSTYEGQHPPLIDADIWDAVQAQLAKNRHERKTGRRASHPSPLRGKLFDESGAPLTPRHTTKSGRRYRYYVSRSSRSDEGAEGTQGWRLPAREIERLVEESVTALLGDGGALTRRLQEAGIDARQVPRLLGRLAAWRGSALEFVNRVELGTDGITLFLDLSPIAPDCGVVARHEIPTRIHRRGVERRIVLDPTQPGAKPTGRDPSLVKAVARAHRWFDDLVTGRVRSLREIAHAEGITERYVGHLMPLAFLAPDIIAAILAGTQPADLTTETLTKRTELPPCWHQQHALLGFE